MSTANQPIEPKKKSRLTTALVVVVGVIGFVTGISQMYRGVKEMSG